MRRLTTAVVSLALAAACGGSPTTPAPGAVLTPAETFEGVWNLTYRADQCTGYRHCFALQGVTYEFPVRLVKAGPGYDGVALLMHHAGANVDLKGTVDSTGTLTLTGFQRAPQVYPYFRDVEVTRLRLTRDSGVVTGDFDFTTRGDSDSWHAAQTRRSGPLVSAVKVADITPISSRQLAGTWTGLLATRDCSSVGTYPCSPFTPAEAYNFELIVTDGGSAVSALLEKPRRVTLEGAVSGSTVVVRGSAQRRDTTSTELLTVRPSTLTRDEVGRLKGSLSVEMRWVYDDGRTSSSDFRVMELLQGVLRPPS
jgi:hypothetical protein